LVRVTVPRARTITRGALRTERVRQRRVERERRVLGGQQLHPARRRPRRHQVAPASRGPTDALRWIGRGTDPVGRQAGYRTSAVPCAERSKAGLGDRTEERGQRQRKPRRDGGAMAARWRRVRGAAVLVEHEYEMLVALGLVLHARLDQRRARAHRVACVEDLRSSAALSRSAPLRSGVRPPRCATTRARLLCPPRGVGRSRATATVRAQINGHGKAGRAQRSACAARYCGGTAATRAGAAHLAAPDECEPCVVAVRTLTDR
jgi:hypothetical protein